MDYSWAKPFPEIEKICTLFNRTELLKVDKIVYTPLVTNYLQEGPQCGLVALAMLMQSANNKTVRRILAVARKLGFSNWGEMFSAADMVELARVFLENSRVELHEGELNCDKIKKFLLDGGMMLVPYDNAHNFSPALLKGDRSHWCAISGVLQTSNDDFYVIARQGKSLNVGIWNLQDLSASNAQLTSQDTTFRDTVFKIADRMGLNKKAVLIFTHKAD